MTKALLSHPMRPASNGLVVRSYGYEKSLFQLVKQPADTVLSVVDVGVDPPLLNWAFLQANWVGSTRADCTKAGACWVFIHERFGQFMYGLYPHDQRWRINPRR